MPSVCGRTERTSGVGSDADTQLQSIQRELDTLKQRRHTLEKQRKKFFRSHRSTIANSSNHNNTQFSRLNSPHAMESSLFIHCSHIPSEAERLRNMKKNVYSEMKEAILKGSEHDSALLMGSFLPEDNPHVCTFGRERRFTQIVDLEGPYYLSTDMELMQAQKNKMLRGFTASTRGRQGMNISSHWNDLQCSGAPGPAAYTPRRGNKKQEQQRPNTVYTQIELVVIAYPMYAPDYRQQPWKRFLLGWPALVLTWVYIVWFVFRILECWSRPIVRGSRSVMDPGWYVTLLPSMCPPVIFVGVYGSWIGWKFFRHN